MAGRPAARQRRGPGFYRELLANFRIEQDRPTHRYLAADAVILDQQLTGTVTGTLLGLPGNSRRITFRILHVFEFKDGLISRENAWLDGAAIQQQLS
jgi:predicted ester cyclase